MRPDNRVCLDCAWFARIVGVEFDPHPRAERFFSPWGANMTNRPRQWNIPYSIHLTGVVAIIASDVDAALADFDSVPLSELIALSRTNDVEVDENDILSEA